MPPNKPNAQPVARVKRLQSPTLHIHLTLYRVHRLWHAEYERANPASPSPPSAELGMHVRLPNAGNENEVVAAILPRMSGAPLRDS
jgi:hypothetical protein